MLTGLLSAAVNLRRSKRSDPFLDDKNRSDLRKRRMLEINVEAGKPPSASHNVDSVRFSGAKSPLELAVFAVSLASRPNSMT
jgi:hypothetical protein